MAEPDSDPGSTPDDTHRNPDKPLGERLIEEGLLTEPQLDLALRERERKGGSLGDVLVHLGFATEEDVTAVLARQNQVEMVDVKNLDIAQDLQSLIGYDTAQTHKVVPLALDDGTLTVAFADSLDIVAQDAVERESGYAIKVVTAPEGHISEAIERNYSRGKSIDETIEQILSGGLLETADSDVDTPMVRLVDQIIAMGITSDATDIHFHPEEKNLKVRVRVDGVMRQELIVPKAIQQAIIARIKLIAGLDITERRVPQDGRIRFSFGTTHVDLRISTLPTQHGESVVMRVLDTGGLRTSLDELGLSENDRERFTRAVNHPFGMVLVTGPTGSGKTTTLYTALSTIDRDSRSVFTLEDPIEYSLSSIRQTQINPDVGMDFATGLRALLRQDPDVILVGEIRDGETAELATRAALTGHLVFSTLHTNSAVGVVARLVDMGVDPYLLPSAIVGVVGQRLLRRLCAHCKKETDGVNPLFDSEELAHLKPATATHWEAVGCDRCHDSGYAGRLAAYEVLLVDESFHPAILDGAAEARLSELARADGMTTMFEDGLAKANRGDTTVAEVMRVLR